MENIKDKLNSETILTKKDIVKLIEYYSKKLDCSDYLRDVKFIHLKDKDAVGFYDFQSELINLDYNNMRTNVKGIMNNLGFDMDSKALINFFLISMAIHELRHCFQKSSYFKTDLNETDKLLLYSFNLYTPVCEDSYNLLYNFIPMERDAHCYSVGEAINIYSTLYGISKSYFPLLRFIEKNDLLKGYGLLKNEVVSPLNIMMDNSYLVRVEDDILELLKSKDINLYYRLVMGLDVTKEEFNRVYFDKDARDSKDSIKTKLLRKIN